MAQPQEQAKLKPKSKHDSNTNVNMVWKGRRKVVGFRCNENLWKAFKRLTKAEGTSVCHFLEGILAGVLVVCNTPVNKRSTIVVENLHIRRVVQRHRRVRHEVEVEPNFYNVKTTNWEFVEGPLNDQGHAIGCACSNCQGDSS